MEKVYNIVVIGAGASGMMMVANLHNKKGVLVLDSNDRAGAKIAISGGGKCNLTNRFVEASNYLGDQRFVSRVFKEFDNIDVIKWFESRGVELDQRDKGKLFCKKSAMEIVDTLGNECNGAEFVYGCKVGSLESKDGQFVVSTNRGDYHTKVVVVASGGLSYPKIGASDIGYKIADKTGHDVIALKAGLVGMTLKQKQAFMRDFAGVSLPVLIRVGKKTVAGDMLFAHQGISGPAVLDASLYWNGGEIEIDFLPGFDISSLSQHNSLLSTQLPLPKKVAKGFLVELGVEDVVSSRVDDGVKKRLLGLKKYRLTPSGTFGYTKAEVTKGGVDTKEIYQNSMMSKKIDNLYFIGEVLNVTGELGGYNFQWAFSSAFICAKSLNMWSFNE